MADPEIIVNNEDIRIEVETDVLDRSTKTLRIVELNEGTIVEIQLNNQDCVDLAAHLIRNIGGFTIAFIPGRVQA